MHTTYIYKVYTAISLAIVLLISGCNAGPGSIQVVHDEQLKDTR